MDRVPEQSAFYGRMASGERVDRISLCNRSGMRVDILTLGGAIHGIWVPDRSGAVENVVLSLPDVAARERDPFFGAVIGRYANRLSGGAVELDGHRFPLRAGADGILLHGGARNLSNTVWTVKDMDLAALTLGCRSADGEGGLPGDVEVKARYTLSEANALRVTLTATTSRLTVVNLALHPYFNLSRRRHRSILTQILTVPADHFTPIDHHQLPTGEIRQVAGTALDFRDPVRLAERIRAHDPQVLLAGGLNHNFVLADRRRDRLELAAMLYEPESGRRLEVRTDQPGLQVYTGNAFDGTNGDAEGQLLLPYAGVALECQHFPDSPRHPHFPSTRLLPGETYNATTSFKFLLAL